MRSPRQGRDRPIESVELKLTFRADRELLDRILKKFPSAVLRQGACEVVIRGEAPADVADRVKEMLDAFRGAANQSKGFK